MPFDRKFRVYVISVAFYIICSAIPLGNPPHILSVEDNPETRMLLKHQLTGPYEVTLATGEDEALDALESSSFDLLLLDINLQAKRGGVEVLHAVRDRDDLPDLPAIALTAFAMPSDREDLLNEGFDAYIAKPFTKATLISTIDETLSSGPAHGQG